MSTDEVKQTYLCTDCKHCHINFFTKAASYIFSFKKPAAFLYRCKRTQRAKHIINNPVIGPVMVKEKMSYCEIERGGAGECGSEGRFWTPKHKKDLLKFLAK